MKRVAYSLVFCILALLVGPLSVSVLGDEIDFVSQVRPILQERCFACHGALKQEGSLRVDSARNLLKGGDSGEVVDLQEIEDSELLLRITDPNESVRMPPEGKPLSKHEIELIRDWIRQGARIPDNDVAEESPQDHWSFRLPRKVKIAEKDLIGRNPIDYLLERSREKHGLNATSKQASRSFLLRRVYLDLIGVPPTMQELQAFAADESPDAYEKVVARLLKQPQYGERWGRHWMDVWRYTDWYGLGAQLRNSQKHIWHWRDWIVESLNQDLGYDQMILEMLAADEVYPTNRNKLRATGFLARNYYLFNRTTWLDSTIEHTGKAFLGLTLNCAKCHDHKYDPITTQEYYQLRAIFEPHQVRMDPLPGTSNLEQDGLPRVFDAHPEIKTYVHQKGNEKDLDKSKVIAPNVPAFFGYQNFSPVSIDLPPTAYQPGLQAFVLQNKLSEIEKEILQAGNAFKSAQRQLKKSETLAANNEKAPSYYTTSKVDTEQSFIADGFDQFDKRVWKVLNGNWKVEEGRLTQSETGSVSRIVESVKHHPQDFILEAKLSVSGGQMWKSFGIRFDAGPEHEKTVYLSAFRDSKVQVSYANNGNTTYPTNALAKIPVNLNQTYTLRIAVKGSLINVAVDGKHLISYAYPVKRQPGKLQLMSFDSVATFDAIQVTALPEQIALYGSNAKKPLTVKEAQAQVSVAEAKLNVARLKKVSIETAHKADLAKFNRPENWRQLIHQAAVSFANLQLAQKRLELNDAQTKLESASDKEKAKLRKTVDSLNKQLKNLEAKKTNPGEKYDSIRASQKALEGPDEKAESRNRPYPNISTGRRTAFANWIIDRSNPLTARVAVNQVWMRHFGQPLVDPVTDFGRRAKPPVQQELLDWLAVDLIENGWKMKRLHHMIVTSNAYKMVGEDEQVKVEPENPYFQVRSPIRMESQVIRDSLLKLSGQLEEKLGGPPIDPAKDAMSRRRSLYFRQSRDHQHKFVGMFDDADILRCYRRQESIIPQQALTLSNSKIAFEAARKIATSISSSHPDERDFVQQAFELILCRPPAAGELRLCLDALAELQQLNKSRTDGELRSLTGIVLSILNSNDFVTIR